MGAEINEEVCWQKRSEGSYEKRAHKCQEPEEEGYVDSVVVPVALRMNEQDVVEEAHVVEEEELLNDIGRLVVKMKHTMENGLDREQVISDLAGAGGGNSSCDGTNMSRKNRCRRRSKNMNGASDERTH